MALTEIKIRLENGLTISGIIEQDVLEGITYRDANDINNVIRSLASGEKYTVVVPAARVMQIDTTAID